MICNEIPRQSTTDPQHIIQSGKVKSLKYFITHSSYERQLERLLSIWEVLGTLSPDPPGQLDVLGHDGHPLGVDGTEVGVLEQSHEVGLAGFLQGHHSGALEAEVSLEILSDFPHKALERQLNKQISEHSFTEKLL